MNSTSKATPAGLEAFIRAQEAQDAKRAVLLITKACRTEFSDSAARMEPGESAALGKRLRDGHHALKSSSADTAEP